MDLTNQLEIDYSSTISLEHRKKYAQFFTPPEIVNCMVNWLLGNPNLIHVLDPAFGLGIFSRYLLSRKPELTITGYDIDPIIYRKAANIFNKNQQINLILGDYINSQWYTKYDGVICNPPYLKFHHYDNKSIISTVNKKLNINLNFHTNLYALFLLKSINQLNKNGRCAYIIPSEFLNSDYGIPVKKYLINSNKVRHIITFNYELNIFDNALTTSSIILCANDNYSENISFSHINTITELKKLEQIISSYPNTMHADFNYKTNSIQTDIKWKNYYIPPKLPKFNHLIPFSTYAKVMRGIATGANDFFSFNKQKIENYGIALSDLQPCICHSTDIHGFCFTDKDFDNLLQDNKRVFILNYNKTQPYNALKAYLDKGIAEKINERYLTSKRNPWYSMETRMPSPIWVSVFNRNRLRFIRNETLAVNLTTFHCIYINTTNNNVDADLLFAYLISNTAQKLFATSGREYGNGLNKFEPNDLNKSLILDIGILSTTDKDQLRTLYKKNKKNNNMSFINEIDLILAKYFLV